MSQISCFFVTELYLYTRSLLRNSAWVWRGFTKLLGVILIFKDLKALHVPRTIQFMFIWKTMEDGANRANP